MAHALHSKGHTLYAPHANAGMREICEVVATQAAPEAVAKQLQVDLTVVGPERPLAEGIADRFKALSLPLFGPVCSAARLESSKAWAKQLMQKYQIPTARFVVCRSPNEAMAVSGNQFAEWGSMVVKPSGLTGGKGVCVCETLADAQSAIREIAAQEIVLEERLTGQELSLLALCDGTKLLPMLPAQDYKQLYDFGRGPNTGGLGACAPAPSLTSDTLQAIYEEIVQRTQNALKGEGICYQGVLYFGVILTQQGPKLLEYNCRFGDPEAQALLPLLESDLAELMSACIGGHLEESAMRWAPKSSCCVVMASHGYPEEYTTGHEILGLPAIKQLPDCLLFHAGTTLDERGRTLTTGGRVLGVTGVANTPQEAAQLAYSAVEQIAFENAYYRRDIGDL